MSDLQRSKSSHKGRELWENNRKHCWITCQSQPDAEPDTLEHAVECNSSYQNYWRNVSVLTVITFPLFSIILNAPFPWSPNPPSYFVRYIPISSCQWHCPRNGLFTAAIPTTMVYEFLFPQICGVCSQPQVKHELRPLLPLQRQRICYIRHEHFKEETTDKPPMVSKLESL
jgi:hypothetical protein